MAKRGSAQQLWLITIPPSHYCERARWALDYAGIPFQERPWPPLLHLAGVARGTIKHGKHTVPQLVAGKALFADSGDIVALANDHMSGSLSRSAHSSACPEPPVATVSNCSTHHLASYTSEGRTVAQLPQPLYPTDPEELRQVHELEELFTTKLGVWTRVVAYHFLFQNKQLAQDVLGLRQRGMPAWRRAFVRLCYPLLRAAIRSGFKVHDQGHVARCMEGVRQVFDQVGQLLAAPGARHGYLVGGRFTAADLTFAAMAAVVLHPPQYGAYLGGLDGLPYGHPAAELRRTAAGQHALRMYELHRVPV